ncbi:GntR family transcriptional regulator, partial [Enterococcus gallinarum]
MSNNEKQKSVEETITLVSEEFTDKEIAQILGDKSGSKALLKLTQIALTNDFPWKIQNRYLFADKLRDDS